MKRNALLLVIGALVAALFVLMQVMFTVREGQVGVLTTFGKPVGSLTAPGLYWKWPWPIQKAYLFDDRAQVVEGPFEETLTKDGKNVLVAVYAGWTIDEPTRFLERVGGPEQAARNLDSLLRHYKSAVLGQQSFASLINVDPKAIQFEHVEQQMLAAVQPEAKERYGINIQFLGIRKLGLPESITQKVFDRMRAERSELAERYRSEGEGEAIKIKAGAERQKDEILAKAEAENKRLRGEGDAQAAEFYQTFEKNPELAMFLRKLEVLEQTLKEKSTVVLSADTVPYDLLKGVEGLPKK